MILDSENGLGWNLAFGRDFLNSFALDETKCVPNVPNHNFFFNPSAAFKVHPLCRWVLIVSPDESCYMYRLSFICADYFKVLSLYDILAAWREVVISNNRHDGKGRPRKGRSKEVIYSRTLNNGDVSIMCCLQVYGEIIICFICILCHCISRVIINACSAIFPG